MIRMWIGWPEILLIILVQVGCEASNEPAPTTAWRADDTTYVFDQPDDTFTLDRELEEISGLAMMENGQIGAVQDENGIIFLLDPSSGEIVEQREFGKNGDFEGIEVGGGRLFVLRSDGRLYIFDDWHGGEFVGDSYDVGLVKGCDAEGLAYQAEPERVLIACKERAGKGLAGKKAIFAYDFHTHTLVEEPVYLLDIEAFEAKIDDHPINEAIQSMLSDHVDLSGFKPAGLAFHPQTGDLYIISSVTKAVIRLNESGEVTAMWMLPEKHFAHPEGIAFGPNGDLFISNEAGNRKHATLLRFRNRSTDASPTPSNE